MRITVLKLGHAGTGYSAHIISGSSFSSPPHLLRLERRSVFAHSGSLLLLAQFILIRPSLTFGAAPPSSSSSLNHEEVIASRSLTLPNGNEIAQRLASDVMTLDLVADELTDRRYY